MEHSALLLIDLQNDFFSQGALAVPHAEEIIDSVNLLITHFESQKRPIIASLDWHPDDHLSFAINAGKPVGELGELHGLPQIWWPKHCVQHSTGAALHASIKTEAIHQRIYKGQDFSVDSYSAFFDNGKRAQTTLHDQLQQQQIQHLWIAGLATDYCVKFSVLDALALGYNVTVIVDGCRAVNLHHEDGENALTEMAEAGATCLPLQQALRSSELTS